MMFLFSLLLSSLAFLGDSNIWLGGEDCSNDTSWSYWFVKETGAESGRSFARSGATITNAAATPADTVHYTELLNDTNTLYNQALRLNGAVDRGELASPELIIVYGGSNDAWFSGHRPGMTDSVTPGELPVTADTSPGDAVTLRRSLQLIVRVLKSRNPDSQIVVVGPPFMTKAPCERVVAVEDIMARTAAEEGLRMVRLDSIGLIDPSVESERFTLTRDGAHTTPEGAKRIGEYVARSLGY